MIHRLQYDSPLGALLLTSDGRGITSLRFAEGERCGSPLVFSAASHWLDSYFSGQSASLPPLTLQGSPFCRRVWQGCLRIPRGCTMTYGELARAIGAPGAARAVGNALGRNPLLLFIPCHRVIPASGGCGRYAAGEELKRLLLERENIDKRLRWV